jgi:cysteine-rich repeat protein
MRRLSLSTIALPVFVLLTACSAPLPDSPFLTSFTTLEETGDGDGDPTGDGDPGDGDGDGDGGDGDGEPGDGDGDGGDGDGDGDGDPGPYCGDAMVDPGEQCDVGAETMFCDGDCTYAMCGDGYHNMLSEACDDGNALNDDACVGACQFNVCGDAIIYAGMEDCDDGNMVDTDECKNDCSLAICGDGVIQDDVEQCEDLNMVNTDACTNTCQIALCGDGILWQGMETCDDNNFDDDDACPSSCEPAYCGDGFTQNNVEDCDDGNMNDLDGCANDCTSDCIGKFTQSWCLQVGTTEQYTRCGSVQNNGNTCINPEIRYGNVVDGGIPRSHGGNNFPVWCQQLGFSGFGNNVQYGNRDCTAPKGGLFGCNGYDENVWHWCDWQDGDWLNEQLDWHGCGDGQDIVSITCTP